MKNNLIRAIVVAAAAGSFAVTAVGAASAAPAGVTPVARPTCPDPAPYGQISCTVSPDGLSVSYNSRGGPSTSNYDKLGNFMCSTHPGEIGYEIFEIPCTAAVAAVHVLPELPIGTWFRSVSE